MRLLAPVFLLAIGSASVAAQTLWSPLPIEGGTYVDTRNSCAYASDTVVYERSLEVPGPWVVYRVDNPNGIPAAQQRPWGIHVVPHASAFDLMVGVCRQASAPGNFWNCVDLADDYGPGQAEAVTVPAQAGTYFVTVTPPPVPAWPGNCGDYTLVAVRPY